MENRLLPASLVTSLSLAVCDPAGHCLPVGPCFPPHPTAPWHEGDERAGPEPPLILEVHDPVWCTGTNSHSEPSTLRFTSYLHHLPPVWSWPQQVSTWNLFFSHLKIGGFHAYLLLLWELGEIRSKTSVRSKVCPQATPKPVTVNCERPEKAAVRSGKHTVSGATRYFPCWAEDLSPYSSCLTNDSFLLLRPRQGSPFLLDAAQSANSGLILLLPWGPMGCVTAICPFGPLPVPPLLLPGLSVLFRDQTCFLHYRISRHRLWSTLEQLHCCYSHQLLSHCHPPPALPLANCVILGKANCIFPVSPMKWAH